MNHGHILLVDDEPGIVTALRPALKAEGHAVSVAVDGTEAIANMALAEPDLVLLDLGLPDMDGKEVIRMIRSTASTPIIVISARHQEDEKIAALDEGADDYVDKPFVLGELMARIRVAMRRREFRKNEPERFDSGALSIDFGTREVMLHGAQIKLSPKEYALLRVLIENVGQVVTQRRLLAGVWGKSSVDPQYLRVYVGMLRNKLEVNPSQPTMILTDPGVGYRLVIPAEGDERAAD